MGLFDKFSKPKLDAYAIDLVKQLKSIGDTRSWRLDVDAKKLWMIWPQGGRSETFIALGNLYQEYTTANPGERTAVLQRHARSMLPKKVPEDFAQAARNLLPVLIVESARGIPALLEAQRKNPGRIQYPSMPLFARIEVALAYDTPETMIHVTASVLEPWHKDFNELLPVSLKNLQRKTPRSIKVLEGGVYSAAFGDSYDASRLLLTDWILSHHVKGQPLAMVPNRGTLLVTGADSEAGIAAMLALAEKQLEQPRPLSPLLLRWSGTAWEPYFPAPHAQRLTEWHWRSRAADHTDQKQQLDQYFQKRGEEVFVATFIVTQDNQSKTFVSHCSWTEGAHSLLPHTDRVALLRRSTSQIVFVPWQALYDECSALMVLSDHSPARFEVKGFPPAAVFDRLFESYNGTSVAKQPG